MKINKTMSLSSKDYSRGNIFGAKCLGYNPIGSCNYTSGILSFK
jgi:hypothetical protein